MKIVILGETLRLQNLILHTKSYNSVLSLDEDCNTRRNSETTNTAQLKCIQSHTGSGCATAASAWLH